MPATSSATRLIGELPPLGEKEGEFFQSGIAKATVDFGSPNLGAKWVLDYFNVTFNSVKIEAAAKQKLSFQFRVFVLVDGVVQYRQFGELLTIAGGEAEKTESKGIETITVNLPQIAEVRGGQQVSLLVEFLEPEQKKQKSGLNLFKAFAKEGTAVMGYTLVRPGE